MTKEISLSRGLVALVDDDDYEWLGQWKWCSFFKNDGPPYAARTEQGRNIFMHRLIMSAPPRQIIDHRNKNTLDNTRSNLRFASEAQNSANRRKISNAKPYKGIFRNKLRWQARVEVNHKGIYLGSYRTPEEAARAYDRAAREYFGDFAQLNFPEQ
jgi:hypothetical protein